MRRKVHFAVHLSIDWTNKFIPLPGAHSYRCFVSLFFAGRWSLRGAGLAALASFGRGFATLGFTGGTERILRLLPGGRYYQKFTCTEKQQFEEIRRHY